jgi:hypothetical protein
MNIVKQIARVLCEDRGYDPDQLEPGNVPCVDGVCPNGDPGHYMWREFMPLALKICDLITVWAWNDDETETNQTQKERTQKLP